VTRWLPPVHSPVSWGAVSAAWAATVGIDAREAPRSLATALRAAYAADEVVLTDSGTTALAVAITAALESAPGAPVALPAYCCYDVATAADTANVPVVLYDIEPETLAPRWESLERALNAGARAVVVVHLYGYPVDVPRAIRLAQAAGAVVIEDAAQGVGARFAGQPAGAIAPLAVLSFGRGKGISGGAGGALLARLDGPARLERARRAVTRPATSWRSLLPLTAQAVLAHPAVYGLPASIPWLKLGETVYRPPSSPRGISVAAAAAVRRALATAEPESARRRLRATGLERAARSGNVLRTVRHAPDALPGYLRLAGCLVPGAALSPNARRQGIMPGYPLALADLAGFRPRIQGSTAADGARLLAATLVTLPTHGLMKAHELAAIESWLGGG
jgi:hypothetical protein